MMIRPPRRERGTGVRAPMRPGTEALDGRRKPGRTDGPVQVILAGARHTALLPM